MTFLLANSLSVLMWRTLIVLLVGNALIGVLEGAVIARVFRLPRTRTIVLLIVANYLSMGVGALLFGVGEQPSPIPEALFAVPLHHASSIIWTCVAISFAVSLIAEWPFCWLAARSAIAPARRAVLAVLLANAITYPLLILLFSDTTNTIGDDVEVVSTREIVSDPVSATVYFIGDDGAVYTIDLDGSNLTLFRYVAAAGRHDVLGWRPPRERESGAWQLILDRSHREEILLEGPDGRCEAFRSNYSADFVRGSFWLAVSGAADLRPADARDWYCTPRGNLGITFGRESTGEMAQITFDTPFVSWTGRCITILPGDLAVFELGQQVCVLSMPTGRMAFLARGRGPVVLLR